jgi:hypothetical protein
MLSGPTPPSRPRMEPVSCHDEVLPFAVVRALGQVAVAPPVTSVTFRGNASHPLLPRVARIFVGHGDISLQRRLCWAASEPARQSAEASYGSRQEPRSCS